MKQDVPQVALPEELAAVKKDWLELSRKDQDRIYAQKFAPEFAKLFAQLPLYGAPADLEKPRFLISVLGLSWQPVALMAAWCRPERILLLGTEESLKLTVDGECVLSLIARIAGLHRDAVESVRVGDPGEADIYRAVRDFLASGVQPRQVFVDPTGGKKSMSAAAALAGFLAGAPLVYVDYAEYHGPNRIPVAGTEYPRLLTNPLEVLGDLEKRDLLAAFDRSDFDEAERLARRLATLLYEPREAEALAELAAGYGAWDRFQFQKARDHLKKARGLIQQFSAAGRWEWVDRIGEQLDRNVEAIKRLAAVDEKPSAIEDGLPLVIWYLAAAERMLEAKKSSLAVLLLYAAMERYAGLCLRADYGLDGEKPDYARVKDRIDPDRYDRVGKRLFGEAYKRRALEGKLMFSNSLQLLATLAPALLTENDLTALKRLAATRNKTMFEHGFLPKTPKAGDVRDYAAAVKAIVARGCKTQQLEELLKDYRFPHLSRR